MSIQLEKILDALPFGLVVTDVQGKIVFSNRAASVVLSRSNDQMQNELIHLLLSSTSIIKAIKTNIPSVSHHTTETGTTVILVELPILLSEEIKAGLILLYEHHVLNELAEHSQKMTDLKQELEMIMNLVGEVVTIADKNGVILRVNDTCEKLLGLKEQDLVGRQVSALAKQGVVDLSATMRVIQEGRKVTVTQTTKTDRRLVVSGYPIYNEDGTLHKVINISRDVTEDQLAKKLDEMRQMIQYFQSEWVRVNRQGENCMVFRSKAMEEVIELAGRIAEVDTTVLILGESGVGKEVVARTIHNLSPRKTKPFVKLNCGAIPETLIESELFGYGKGTFTGGNREGKPGVIVSANEGTLFLDEIGELPLQLQVKLLQVLQDKRFTPLGKTTPIEVDVRFVAATNRNLEKMVEEGRFREDLYYRLNVIPMTIPALRERKEDIPFLVEHFLHFYNNTHHKHKTIGKQAIQALIDYAWPGNVRELRNTIERLVVTTFEPEIQVQNLPNKMRESMSQKPLWRVGVTLKEAVAEYEREILQQTLNQSRTLKEVSEKLGAEISTISRKVKKYNLTFAELQIK